MVRKFYNCSPRYSSFEKKKKTAPVPRVPSPQSRNKHNKLSRPSQETPSHQNKLHSSSPPNHSKPPTPPHHSKPYSSMSGPTAPSAPQFPVPSFSHGGVLNSPSPPPSFPYSYPAPASAGPHPPNHPPPWAQPHASGQTQNSQSKTSVVSSFFDRLSLR